MINTNFIVLAPYNVRSINKHAALDLIRFSPGGISRAELARHLQISRSAITTIVNDLIDIGVVHEAKSGPTTGGRRPVMLEINPRQGHVAGVDMGATHLTVSLADLSARIHYQNEIPFQIAQGPDSGLRVLDEHLRNALEKAGFGLKDLLAVGIGVPGPVVIESGAVMSPPIMPGWDAFPIKARMEQVWKVPVTLNNDAELGVLGEWAYGAGRGEQNLIYIKVGTGIGAGFMLNSSLYRGTSGSAGEIGHVTIDPQGPLCTCGNHGCLESMAGGGAIARRAIEAVRAGERTRLADITPIETITARDIGEAAQLGDLVAQQIVTQAGEYLGTAIANLVNLFNPGLVVVGGGVARMGDLLLEPIRRNVETRCLKATARPVRVTTSVLGRRASSVGAIVQALSVALHGMTDSGQA